MNVQTGNVVLPDTLHRKNLVIVGCGASAVLLLTALLKHYSTTNAPLLTITIIDDNPTAPRGLAYGCSHPALILNVPAQRMGAYGENPAHFYQWLQQTHQWRTLHPDFATLHIQPDDFVPRMLYGEYLHSVLDEVGAQLQHAGHRIELIAERVVAVTAAHESGSVRVATNRNQHFSADALIVATGNYPAFQNPVLSPAIFASPYCHAANQCAWQQQRDLVVIGSGLSMVDAVQMASAQGFNGRFHIFSGHGLLPLSHTETHQHHALPAFQTSAITAAQLLRDVRAYLAANQRQGIAWQDVINQLRSQNNFIWSELAETERQALRRCLPWWNIARHRIPPAIYQALQVLKTAGRLRIHKAQVKRIDAVANGFQLTLARSIKTPAHVLPRKIKIIADKAIICAGYLPGFNTTELLCKELIDDAQTLRAVLGKADAHYRLSSAHAIYAIGPALGGVLFETTAINEIRQQAQVIAQQIYSSKLLANPINAQTSNTLITPIL